MTSFSFLSGRLIPLKEIALISTFLPSNTKKFRLTRSFSDVMTGAICAKGYPFAQIAPVITSENDLVSLNFFVFEGKKVEIRAISFNGISLPENRLKEVMSLTEGKIYNPDLLDTDREGIEEFYHALGYLTAGVEKFQTRYEERSQEIDIHIKVHEGVKTEIARVDIDG